ncbi:MAG: FAD-dependent oxidoreductase [Clostridia bacterium]|nr:FAD-dependent oxidoreductase [Clostridia bacterium]
MDSIWSEASKNDGFPQLKGDLKTDVVIVGGGLAGVLCLKELTDRGVDCVLLEAKSIGSGITKNTTAKITFQHGLIYDKLIKNVGLEKAKQYLTANKNALEKFKKMAEEFPCDFEEKDAFVYSATDRIKIENEIKAYEKLGFSAEFISSIPLPVECIGAVKVKNQAQFNPLEFLFSVAKGLRIYENTKVLEFMPEKVVCSGGTVTAKRIIVATHFPIINKHGGYSLKLYQDRSYVIAVKNGPDVKGMYLEDRGNSFSFRNYKNYLLIGSGSHRTGKKSVGYKASEDFCKKNFPDARIEYRFATQDCMSLDGIPYIGKYSKGSENLYVATGFNKWGMTSSMVCADILSDIITGVKNPYTDVFSPSRSSLHLKLFENIFHSVVGLITPTAPRCPHMGCALKYNKEEHSWDCPCHGSRFTQKGELIDNPATDDLNKD